MEPLEYVETSTLLKELQKRFDDTIFIASAKMTGEVGDIVLSLTGSYHSVLGLAVIARMAAEAGDGSHENNTAD
jgi:hypothetical protein